MATRYGLTGTVAAAGAAILAVLIALSPSERAQSLGLTQHGQTITVQDAGAADAVALVAVAPGTPGQVYTISDAGLPHWAAASGGSPWGATVVDPMTGTGWTAAETPAGASATWSGGTLALSMPSGTTGTLRQQYVVTIPEGSTAWDFAIRVQATTGAGTSSALVGLYFILNSGATQYFGANVRGDGAIYVGWATPSMGNDPFAGTTLSLGGGQSWLRLSRTTAGVWIVWYGEGSDGELPGKWTRRYVLDTVEGASSAPYEVQIIAEGVGWPPSVNWVATVRAIHTTWSGSL